jgi:hypothetical protein
VRTRDGPADAVRLRPSPSPLQALYYDKGMPTELYHEYLERGVDNGTLSVPTKKEQRISSMLGWLEVVQEQGERARKDYFSSDRHRYDSGMHGDPYGHGAMGMRHGPLGGHPLGDNPEWKDDAEWEADLAKDHGMGAEHDPEYYEKIAERQQALWDERLHGMHGGAGLKARGAGLSGLHGGLSGLHGAAEHDTDAARRWKEDLDKGEKKSAEDIARKHHDRAAGLVGSQEVRDASLEGVRALQEDAKRWEEDAKRSEDVPFPHAELGGAPVKETGYKRPASWAHVDEAEAAIRAAREAGVAAAKDSAGEAPRWSTGAREAGRKELAEAARAANAAAGTATAGVGEQ